VAALDPALVAGRGASLGMIEQEAENATTNGTTLAFDTSAYTLAAEASGRRAVKLLPGQYVEFTLTRPANALTIRYSIPDAPTGGHSGWGASQCHVLRDRRRRASLALRPPGRAQRDRGAHRSMRPRSC
jgi:hypothetical protein